MLEKKISFKTYFIGLTAVSIKHIYDLLANISISPLKIEDLIKELDKINPLLEATNSFIVVSDATKFAIPYVSPSCKQIIGYSPQDWTTKGVAFLIENYCMADAAVNELYFKQITQYKKQVSASEIQDYNFTSSFRFYHKQGYFIWLHNHWIFYYNDVNGKMIYSISILTNIDNFKKNDSCSLQIFKINQKTGKQTSVETNRQAVYGLNPLSNTEITILKLLSEGKENPEIAKQLSLKESTIKTYRKTLLKKTWCSNTVELVYYAIRNGLID